jgi:thiol:disulfide interchange protein DsbD
MSRPSLLAALTLLLVAAAPADAQSASRHANVTFSSKGEAKPGGTIEVTAVAEVDQAWHIYATETENGLATTFELTLPPGVTLEGGVKEPAPHREEIEFVGPVDIHRGTVTFTRTLRLGPEVKGALSIPARLAWQACDDANTQCVEGAATGSIELVVDSPSVTRAPAADDPNAPEVVASARLVRRAAERVDLVTELRMKPGWHIYGTTTPNGLPTKLEVALPAGVTAQGPLEEPAAHTEEIEFVGAVSIHRGVVLLVQPLAVTPGADGAVTGKVSWQVCDDANTKCLQGDLPFSLPLADAVTEASAVAPVDTGAPATTTEPAPTTTAPVPPTPPAGTDAVAPAPDSNLWTLFAASLGLGVLMLFQPCTYPMIPITVSIFSKGKALPRRTAVLRAAAYAGGIVLSFVLVGAIVQVAFGAAGQGRLNELATNPWVNLVIGAVFVYFAFSFFGYYEVGLPGPLQRLMQLGNAKRESDGTVPVWSLFLMGFFFVLTSYTCGAPIVLALFATSAQDPHPLAVVFATAVFATTVAAPFFVLSLVPGAVRSLPKSGSWFSVFKVVIGFLELGFALKFFRGSDVIWDIGVLPRPVILGLWALLCLSAALYLLGRFPVAFPHDPDLRQPSTGRGFWAGLFLVLASYFGLGVTGRPLLEELEAFILAEHETDGDAVKFGPLAYRTSLKALEEGQAKAKRTGKPVLLIFTGHNCVNCALMEAKILPRKEVVDRLEDIPRVALFTDRGEEEKKHLTFMEERFKTTVLPSFYLVDGDGVVRAAQNGGSDEATFVEFLERGGL